MLLQSSPVAHYVARRMNLIWKSESLKEKIFWRKLGKEKTRNLFANGISLFLLALKFNKKENVQNAIPIKNVNVWMCPMCIFVSVETFLSLNMCQYDHSYNSLKNSKKFWKMKNIWNWVAPCPPTFKFSPLIMFGNGLMVIGLNWLGSSCRKDFRSICGNIQYFAKWRKFQEKSRKIYQKQKLIAFCLHCSLAWTCPIQLW